MGRFITKAAPAVEVDNIVLPVECGDKLMDLVKADKLVANSNMPPHISSFQLQLNMCWMLTHSPPCFIVDVLLPHGASNMRHMSLNFVEKCD